MDHLKLAWNASDEFDLTDTFLSLPKPKQNLFSKFAKMLWRIIDKLSLFCKTLEPREIHINERILEIPFVFQHLPQSGRILDVGCTNSPLALQLACLGYQVTGVDTRNYPFSHPNLKFYQIDVKQLLLEEEYYDCALLVSTIEHVGFGHYGDEIGFSDKEFFDKVARHVKPGGHIIMTAPFGKSFECNWYRIYDSKRLNTLISGHSVITKVFARRSSLLEWQLCSEVDLEDVSSSNLPMNGLVLLKIGR